MIVFFLQFGYNGAAHEKMIREKISLINRKLTGVTEDGHSVSISAGVASGNGTESAEELFVRADKALYEAKNSGRRNCVFSK